MKFLNSSLIQTPLGAMIAIADEKGLFLLEFEDQKNLERKMKALIAKTNTEIRYESNTIINLISQELYHYFAGTLKSFTTPIHVIGTPFQCKTWHFLSTISYATLYTYAQQAAMIGNKKACRAVAHANSNNTLAIIIPCHRIIGSNGKLGGYAGGLDRKQWLIAHEQQNL